MIEQKRLSGNPDGRKPIPLPDRASEIVEESAARGLSNVGIAHALGITRPTFDKWRKQFPEIEEAFHRGRERERIALHGRLYEIATTSKNEQAASFAAVYLLNCRHGYREPADNSGRSNVIIQLPGPMSREQFIRQVNVIESKEDDDEQL